LRDLSRRTRSMAAEIREKFYWLVGLLVPQWPLGVFMHLNAIVTQCARGIVPIVRVHHEAAWKDADPALQNAHIYVHFEAVYTFALK